MTILQEMGKQAKEAAILLATLPTKTKNTVLQKAADALLQQKQTILTENEKDVTAAMAAGIKGAFIDRLTLDEKRLNEMANGLQEVATLVDPVGKLQSINTLENGLIIKQMSVPMGVIGIIFEARPNVTADAFGLCFKAGNAVLLRGGKEAIATNKAIVSVFQNVLAEMDLPKAAVQIVQDTSRESANEMMRLQGYLDVLIPRGGAGLIQTVVQNSTVPVIQTGVGNCHIYVDESADLEKAIPIVMNAKTQRPGVCNACESLLIHESLKDSFLPMIGEALQQKQVEIRGDETVCEKVVGAVKATPQDWETEYADYIISAKVVKNIDEAIAHIRKYSTGHSEAIVTENKENAERFLQQVDAAAVYVNASTRFTDGGQSGLGAEIGISTQKLHARGPMGLKALTTTKYMIYGDGQIRI